MLFNTSAALTSHNGNYYVIYCSTLLHPYSYGSKTKTEYTHATTAFTNNAIYA